MCELKKRINNIKMNLMKKKLTMSVQRLLVFESGFAIYEIRQAKIEALHERIVEQHESCLEAFDPLEDDTFHNDFSGKS